MVDFKKVDPWILWILGVCSGMFLDAFGHPILKFILIYLLIFTIYEIARSFWQNHYQNKFYKKMFCVWCLIPDTGKIYDTECGQLFCTGSGTPYDNGMKYCPYCGRGLVAARVNTKGEQ